MVVSKDSKRKRKESSTPIQQQQQSSSTIESSPEMPKRTKVQAQRKFAQGQSAPQSSSYSSLIASSSSNTGPSTSSESRDPPTEILPNKRPKTEDFLTFLCFRGTSALPPHLDFLNQGQSREPPRSIRKSPNKRVNKKGKKLKSTITSSAKSIPNQLDDNDDDGGTGALNINQNNQTFDNNRNHNNDNNTEKNDINNPKKNADAIHNVNSTQEYDNTKNEDVPSFAVRKRAEIITDGNRHRNNSNMNKNFAKCNSSVDASNASVNTTLKRSSRSMARDAKIILDAVPIAEKNNYQKQNCANKNNDSPNVTEELQQQQLQTVNSKISRKTDRKSETPSKESETTTTDRSQKGNCKNDSERKIASTGRKSENKEAKVPTKRSRQKESPIFIPSPEPSGRMTRQRAFFEPVKIPPKESNEQLPMNNTSEKPVDEKFSIKEPNKCDEIANQQSSKVSDLSTETNGNKNLNKSKQKTVIDDIIKDESISIPPTKTNSTSDDIKSKVDLNVFDFSSDDEQPLAKAIKFKKTTDDGNDNNDRFRKSTSTQCVNVKSNTNKLIEKSDLIEENKIEEGTQETGKKESPITIKKGKGKRTTSAVKNNMKNTKLKKDSTEISICPLTQSNQSQSPTQTQSVKELNNDKDLILTRSPKKTVSNNRSGRKKINNGNSNNNNSNNKNKNDNHNVVKDQDELDVENSKSPIPVRSQRPSRKTKEAATIYMGIIGHRLQLGDDEDDDISLSSFDRPNVREMEKMENELKKNANLNSKQQQIINESSAIPKQMKMEESPPPMVSSILTISNEKIHTGRRGRPPKIHKQAATNLPGEPLVKRVMEGMLIKKGALAKITGQQNVPAVVVENLNEIKNGKIELPKSSINEDDEDFLLNEELNETKRKLEKSFSDSDDEPLAIKAHVKTDDRTDNNNMNNCFGKNNFTGAPAASNAIREVQLQQQQQKQQQQNSIASTNLCTLTMLPLTTKPIATTTTPPPPTTATAITTPASMSTTAAACTLLSVGGSGGANSGTHTLLPSSLLTGPTNICLPAITTTASVISNITGQTQIQHTPFKVIEKKSPVPTSKILNVPATYGIPPTSPTGVMPASLTSAFGKSPLYVPQSPAHYHSHTVPQCHARTAVNIPPPLYSSQQNQQMQTNKLPSIAPATSSSTSAIVTSHLNATTISSIKYQTPPTTYPPPIEAYPSPKINPNFLTPKFDRNTFPRHCNLGNGPNSFTSPSPVKFDMPTSSGGLLKNSQLSQVNSNSNANLKNLSPYPSNLVLPNNLTTMTSTLAATAGATATGASGTAMTSTAMANSNANTSNSDPLKDEIGSILAANLMPSKEESGKIFGIASVSLAQSSGPDNTKCTLGKCGSIHKPVLGPVVPTESYIGDQLSGKERRKAKVNMTHEQIHKWLIECSSNPDEIQDDLDDDFDSDLRPNNYSTTPPPTRDDKESTSFSSSSKATRDLGKSESAWSAKGPSLKATPVVATNNGNSAANNSRNKDDLKFNDIMVNSPQEEELEKTSPIMNLMSRDRSNTKKPATSSPISVEEKSLRYERKLDRKHNYNKDTRSPIPSKEKETVKTTEKESSLSITKKNNDGSIGKQQIGTITTHQKLTNQRKFESPVNSPTTVTTTTVANKSNRRKAITDFTNTLGDTTGTLDVKADGGQSVEINMDNVSRTPRRTPVYQQKQTIKQQSRCEQLRETTTTSHKKSAPFSYGGAFSVDNEKSIYSFDKDDGDEADNTNRKSATAAYRRQQQETGDASGLNEAIVANNQRGGNSSKKRTSNAVPGKANNVAAIKQQQQVSSVSLTLSPTEKTKLVKVSLDADTVKPVTTKSVRNVENNIAEQNKNSKKGIVESAIDNNEANSTDSTEGHTFYIPLQGVGTSGEGEGGIQGVAVKLGREGPNGPNQKVIMHATLVTKAQMGANSKPLPESMNVSDIVKNLMNGDKKSTGTGTSVAAASAAATVIPSALPTSNSTNDNLKNVPVGAVQPRFKNDVLQPSTSSSNMAGGNLVRVNSNSSLLSGSIKSRNVITGVSGGGAGSSQTIITCSKKFKDDIPIKMANNTAFPRHDDPTQMVEAPIFRPSEKEFADPIEFIERITPIAARFGICKIIPPTSFKPECRISDEMRFTAYNQYVHKMLHRWGPSTKELSAIKKYLTTQSIVMNHPPWIGGMEVDLPRLYHTVQELGGLKEVIEKKKWARVAEEMCIPKLAQDRVTKLDDIYCKYLLPYDTLSPAERQKLFDEVEADWAKREARARRNADRFVNTESVSNEEDDVTSENDEEESEEEVDGVSMECIVKGRSMPLSQFYRIARNTMALWFKNTEPTVNEVEAEFWRHVAVRDSHVCVHSGSIDSSGWGYGFPSPGPKGKGSNYARHPWNLKVMTNNSGSVLRSLGPVMGVTVPTLHVGMLFSACCWYRDPHGLSWIEYLHTGASKLWYGIPDDQSANFRAALTTLIPTHCQNKTIWLPCDTVMVPPHMLTDRGVSLCRIEQKPGEFIVVFPRAYTSSLATGYVVSESVYFATSSWLDLAKDDFRDIHDSCEPAMFSLEQLLFALGYDQRVPPDALKQMLPMLKEVYEKETAAREQLKAAGVTSTEKITNEKGSKSKKQQLPPYKSIESECDLCRANLYISMVRTDEGNVYCLQHALKNLNNGNTQAKKCKLIYAYNVDDIENLIKTLKERMQQKRNMNTGKKQK